MIRNALALVTAAAVLVACGQTTNPPAPIAKADVVITENDHAVTARTGQKIELVLHAKNGMSNWSGVTVDDPAVLRAVPNGITAAIGVTIVEYQALKPGTATIRATATPTCSPGQACPQFAMLFQVVVTVSA